jgi:hypothetical protein
LVFDSIAALDPRRCAIDDTWIYVFDQSGALRL